MPIASYSVLTGKPVSGAVVSGASAHYQIVVTGGPREMTIAVNIESVDGSEVLYVIEPNFVPPSASGLAELTPGIHALRSVPGGLALDFVRETIAGKPMVSRAQMALLPIANSHAEFMREALEHGARRESKAHALENAVVALLNEAVADGGAMVYAFGSAYADGGVVDGIHDIHMNQGNPAGNHGGDNGIWQDGALFLKLSKQPGWTALFIAFQTESWTTDAAGDPVQPG